MVEKPDPPAAQGGYFTFSRIVPAVVRAVGRFWTGLFERRIPLMAAGLAFYFLLGLIPFLFIVAATTAYFLKRNPGIRDQVTVFVSTILPPGIGEKVIEQVQTAAVGWQTLGALGLGALVLVAMGLFDALDEGINAAMGTKKKVGFLTGRIISLAYVIGAILFFSVAGVAGYSLDLLRAVPFFQNHPQLIAVPGKFLSAWVFAAFLFILYMTVPVKIPRWWKAVLVALAVTGAWATLQNLGTVITAGISRRQAIYGALFGATLFLTWMYLLALLILLGAKLLDAWRTPPWKFGRKDEG